jgi:DNA-binding transcriptional regulator YhcF (GntR family)
MVSVAVTLAGIHGSGENQMQIALSKNSEVPLRQQLAEQIVFLITTGQLRAGDALPSVRALARQSKVHHNTVSEAYQQLVSRGWLTRRRGTQLVVGTISGALLAKPHTLDELINETVERAKEMGYTLQALRQKVLERLMAQPPDHFLVVEQEPGLREIIRQEVVDSVGLPVESCSLEDFASEPSLAIGAQVLAANHILGDLKMLVPQSRPTIGLVYSQAAEHVDLIRKLKSPSIVAVVSVSEGLLRTAKGLLAPAMGRKHTLNEVLVVRGATVRLETVDLAFCDTITVPMVRSRRKLHYRLIANACLEHLALSHGRR